MKFLRQNLKLFYQNREMWAWYFILGISLWHILFSFYTPKPAPKIDPLTGWDLITPLLALIVLGCAVGRLTSAIWSKPVFFCIPAQRETFHKTILFIGMAAAAIIYVTMMIITPWGILRSPGVIISLLGFYLMVYSLIVIMSIWLNRLFFVIPYFSLFVMPLMNRLEMLSLIQKLLLTHPWGAAGACWIVNLLIYFPKSTKYISRRLCGVPSMTFFASLETPGSDFQSLNTQKHFISKKISGAITRFFLERIRSNNQSAIAPHVWSRIFVIMGSFISNWRIIFFDGPIIFLSVGVLISFIKLIELQSFVYFFIGLLGGQICVMSGSDIFLPIDRRARFFSEITALMTAICIMLAIAATFAFLAKILPRNITSFINLDWSTDFVSVHLKYIFLTMILLPITGGLITLYRKKSFLSILSITGMAVFLLCIHYQIFKKGIFTLNTFNISFFLIAAVISFGFYVTAKYYSSIRHPLV